ncbi:hypothetical protein SAMN05443270_5127 [Lacrimispora sphenoides]|jgi:uncharacterized protein YdhG (YjbR/CyaY superfamily)|uniref:DUF1801 domain-containing protein n=1 Tax=Lacrimispora sphenoides TaxID=29370 RepID=UPI0008CD8C70|nr:DUF1801 domain-containing protein [Lacrimispora sphenoides]SEU31621.1 hypothetical protein SAMN05443270_5127 [Lacrimispora sphenoides]
MNDDVKNYIDQYRKEIIELFHILRNLIISSVHENVKEKLWAKLPSYYIEDKFIRLIPFKDHINIEAKSILQYKKELKEFQITPKGMLQIYIDQEIPESLLQEIFKASLLE